MDQRLTESIARLRKIVDKIEIRGLFKLARARIDIDADAHGVCAIVSFVAPDVYGQIPTTDMTRVTHRVSISPLLLTQSKLNDHGIAALILDAFLKGCRHEAMESFWFDGEIHTDPHKLTTRGGF